MQHLACRSELTTANVELMYKTLATVLYVLTYGFIPSKNIIQIQKHREKLVDKVLANKNETCGV